MRQLIDAGADQSVVNTEGRTAADIVSLAIN